MLTVAHGRTTPVGSVSYDDWLFKAKNRIFMMEGRVVAVVVLCLVNRYATLSDVVCHMGRIATCKVPISICLVFVSDDGHSGSSFLGVTQGLD